MHYYLLQFFNQYEPYNYPQTLFISKEPQDFKSIFKNINRKLTSKYSFEDFEKDNIDEEIDEELNYDDFLYSKLIIELNALGFKEVHFDTLTYGPDDSEEGLFVWEDF